MNSTPHPDKGYRFPVKIISHCVWLDFTLLSYRGIEKMMLTVGDLHHLGDDTGVVSEVWTRLRQRLRRKYFD